MRLQNLLRTRFSNWPAKYRPTWNGVLNGIVPNAADVPTSLSVSSQVPLIPGPHDFPAPVAANEFHTMRALDRVTPSNVRVVVLGQDPYPRKRQATGRAFEQGNLASWDDDVAYGLKHVIQRLAEHRTGNNWYVRSDAAWSDVRAYASSVGLPSVKQLYDRWENQGVIFLNFVLTYTLPAHVFTGHARYWKPVVTAILRHLATRQSKRVVFALWGQKCGTFFSSARVLDAAQAAGTFGNCRVVRSSHPSARPQGGARAPFLRGRNQFRTINENLQDLGESAITW
jgi:uracil-DNA glycosylase